MAYLFNTDYEQQLFNERPYLLESNKINQELEYLLWWVDPAATLWTTKKYSQNYIDYVSLFTKQTVISEDRKNSEVIPWWGNYDNIERKKYLNSKLTCWQILKQHDLLPKNSVILFDYPEEIEDGMVYKECFNFSGRGFVTTNLKALKKLRLPIIKEPIFFRKFDISFLSTGNFEKGIVTENFVDKSFQYKGTSLKLDKEIPKHLVAQFIEKVVPFLKGEMGLSFEDYWSIDSFIYEEDGELKLYPATEVNYRKTMGLITLLLQKKWGSHFGHFSLLLRKRTAANQKWFTQNLICEDGGYIFLSPEDTYFQTYVVFGKDQDSFDEFANKIS